MRAYKSTETDPKQSSGSYYSWVKVKNGKIIQIGEELGREGEVTWESSFDSNGDLKTCMKSIARRWPNLYKKVKKFHKGMPTIRDIKRADTEQEANRLIYDIADLEAKLFIKRNDLLNMRKTTHGNPPNR